MRRLGASNASRRFTGGACRFLLLSVGLASIAGGVPAQAVTVQTTPSWAQLSATVSDVWGADAAAGFDRDTGQTLLFGGERMYAQRGDFATDGTWLWHAATSSWELLSPSTKPSPREAASMAFDASTHQMMLFGGYDPGQVVYLTDTWLWTGSTWASRATVAHPPPRAKIVYDAASHQLLAVGGESDTGSSVADTWTWTGTSWTRLAPSQTPPAGVPYALAFDQATGQLVAVYPTSGTAAQTWVWNGTTWRLLTTATAVPAFVRSASATYDIALGKLVLVGYSTFTTGIQAWAWTGSNWTSLPTAPSARPSTVTLVFNAAKGQLLMFVPQNTDTGPSNQTWVLDAPTSTTLSAAPAAPTSTTSVEFFDGTTPIGGCLARGLTRGVATCTSTLTAGSHTLTARYLPSIGYLSSTSAPVVLAVT